MGVGSMHRPGHHAGLLAGINHVLDAVDTERLTLYTLLVQVEKSFWPVPRELFRKRR